MIRKPITKPRCIIAELGSTKLTGKVMRECPQSAVLSQKLQFLAVKKLLTMLGTLRET